MVVVKQTLSVSVSIADAILEGLQVAASKNLQAALKEAGVPDGVEVKVDVETRKYDYLATATWVGIEPDKDDIDD